MEKFARRYLRLPYAPCQRELRRDEMITSSINGFSRQDERRVRSTEHVRTWLFVFDLVAFVKGQHGIGIRSFLVISFASECSLSYGCHGGQERGTRWSV